MGSWLHVSSGSVFKASSRTRVSNAGTSGQSCGDKVVAAAQHEAAFVVEDSKADVERCGRLRDCDTYLGRRLILPVLVEEDFLELALSAIGIKATFVSDEGGASRRSPTQLADTKQRREKTKLKYVHGGVLVIPLSPTKYRPK